MDPEIQQVRFATHLFITYWHFNYMVRTYRPGWEYTVAWGNVGQCQETLNIWQILTTGCQKGNEIQIA